jgi:hypothetical protein
VLGAVAVVLATAASIVDKRESLRWLWVGLGVAGALVAAPTGSSQPPTGHIELRQQAPLLRHRDMDDERSKER